MTSSNKTSFQFFAPNDGVSLEYEDKAELRILLPDGFIDAVRRYPFFVISSCEVYIMDNDSKHLVPSIFSYHRYNIELTINFGETDYSITEGQTPRITLQLRSIQNGFNITLYPVSYERAMEFDFDAEAFLSFELGLSHATEGIMGYIITVNTLLPSTGVDFTNTPLSMYIPPIIQRGLVEVDIPPFFTIIDDEIFENAQIFYLVTTIGPDVPEGFPCFNTRFGDAKCFGRTGATNIQITDNDGIIPHTALSLS